MTFGKIQEIITFQINELINEFYSEDMIFRIEYSEKARTNLKDMHVQEDLTLITDSQNLRWLVYCANEDISSFEGKLQYKIIKE